MEALTLTADVSPEELVKLGATDPGFYNRTFFPKTFRQESPEFHSQINEALGDPSYRLLNIQAFRDSAKTTLCRAATSRRIAYGISRTILYVGVSEASALRSIHWLKKNIETNTLWASTFGLKRGRKWQETEIEIEHTTFGHTIWVLGVGITGNIRGINFDDYRPDFIMLDDVLSDENSATSEQREKISNLILGALKDSLAPRTEEPNAKLAMLTTPQHNDDAASQAKLDPSFKTLRFGCWTPETMDLPVEKQESSWPARYPSEHVRKEKLDAMARNRLSIFTREREVRLISKESAAFRPGWLRVCSDYPVMPFCVMGIDPVPPPTEAQRAKGFQGKDYEALSVWAMDNGQYYLMDYMRNRGHDPNWTMMAFFKLASQYRIMRACVETVAYQTTLKWILEQEMKRRREYYPIFEYTDKRAKVTRIVGAYSGIGALGLLNIRPEHTEFAQEFNDYSETHDGVDDLLDSGAMALSLLVNPTREGQQGSSDRFSDVEDFPLIGRCP